MGVDLEQCPPNWMPTSLEQVFELHDDRREPLNSDQRASIKGDYPYYGANGQVDAINKFNYDGDYLLVAEDGGYFEEPQRGVARCVSGQFWVNNHAHVIKAVPGLVPALYQHYLNAIDWSPHVTGTTRLKLTQAALRQIPVPLPPEAEQRRIVAKFDALQSRTRLAHEALAAIPALLDHYRQSVLAAAFRGDLTADWRASKAKRTSVAAALASIEVPPRPARYGSRSEVLSEGDYALAVGNPDSELPASWQWVPLVDIARLESGHTPSRQHPEWWGGEIPWVSIPDARDNHGRIIEKTTITTNELGLANSAARLLPACTVCLCRTAASIGYVTVFGRPMATSQDFVNWTCTSAIDPHWLKFLLMAEYQALLRFSKGSAHKTVYFPEVVSFHVGLPPIEEQHQIVKIVERQMRRIDELAVIVRTALANCSSLDQATLATAFRGELIPQDPADEPASVLLDRIRAARAQAGDAPRPRRPRTPAAAPPPARAAEPATPYRAAASDAYATLLVAIRAQGSLASADAQAVTGLDAAGVRPLLQRLVAEGMAKVEGQKRGTRYVATKGTAR